ncbi:flagellar brake protein [Anaeropeptidivorans aminofermentans]|uniref:flagellar brake protein n=1 Tax=Anaeropeptidivorans aminofermentans TaxID=2934315 RepID=UPI002024BDDE|nr:flagellar brake protein [Anaeropeptidivorans aminofermentans]
MLYKSIKTGDRVEIQLKRDYKNSKVYVSQVEDVRKDKRVLVYMPISYGKIIEIPLNLSYEFLFFTDGGLIKFEGKVEKYIYDDKFSFMLLKLESEGESVQRRDYYRLPCALTMKFAKSSKDGEEEEGSEEELHSGVIKDISGGGIKFVSNFDVEEKDFIKCIIDLKTNEIVVLGEIVQKFYFPKSNYRYQYRAKFSGILPSAQEQIIQFIFEEQKRQLRRMQE